MENWKPIPEFAGRYDASTEGRVRSWYLANQFGERRRTHPRPLTGGRTSGYRTVCLIHPEEGKQWYYVHRLVLQTFVGECLEGQEASHTDGNEDNCCLSNLVWEHHKENEERKVGHGTVPRGERNGHAVLTEKQVREIRLLHSDGMSNKDLAEQFSVSPSEVSSIINMRVWTHLPPPPVLIRKSMKRKCTLCAEQVIDIRGRYAQGDVSQSELARQFGVSHVTINRIVHRKLWPDIGV